MQVPSFWLRVNMNTLAMDFGNLLRRSVLIFSNLTSRGWAVSLKQDVLWLWHQLTIFSSFPTGPASSLIIYSMRLQTVRWQNTSISVLRWSSQWEKADTVQHKITSCCRLTALYPTLEVSSLTSPYLKMAGLISRTSNDCLLCIITINGIGNSLWHVIIQTRLWCNAEQWRPPPTICSLGWTGRRLYKVGITDLLLR